MFFFSTNPKGRGAPPEGTPLKVAVTQQISESWRTFEILFFLRNPEKPQLCLRLGFFLELFDWEVLKTEA